MTTLEQKIDQIWKENKKTARLAHEKCFAKIFYPISMRTNWETYDCFENIPTLKNESASWSSFRHLLISFLREKIDNCLQKQQGLRREYLNYKVGFFFISFSKCYGQRLWDKKLEENSEKNARSDLKMRF